MANFNPSSPDTVGIEFLPHGGSSLAVQGVNGWGVSVPASVTEDVPALRIAGVESDVLSLGVVADIYAGATSVAVPGAVGARTVLTVAPTADVGRDGWTDFGGATTNLWSDVDDNPDSSASQVDGVRDPAMVVGFDFIQWRFGGLAAFPAGRRITDVKVRMRIIGGNIGLRFFGLFGGSDLRTTGYTGGTWRVVEFTYGEVCPWTRDLWTAADLADLASGAATLQVQRQDSSGGFFIPQIAALQLQVIHYAETRVAVAPVTGSLDPDTYTLFTRQPAAPASPWAKVAGTTYWIVLRRLTRPGSDPVVGWRSLLATGVPSSIPRAARPVTVTDGLPAITGAATTHAPGIHLLTDANDPSTGSADSQPYGHLVGSIDLSSGANDQRFTPAVSGTYGVLRALVKVPADVGASRLRMEVRRVSDDVVFGTGVEVTAAQALDATDRGNGWRLVQAQMATGGALVGGTLYKVVLSVVGGTAAWRVGLVVGIAGETLVNSPGGFQGTTSYATVNGSSTVNVAKTGGTIPGQAQASDWLIQVGLLPDPLASVAAAVETLPLAPPRAPGIV